MIFKHFIFLIVAAISTVLLPCTDEMSWAKGPEETMQAEFTANVHWKFEKKKNTREGTMKLNATTILELDRAGSGLDHKPLLTPVALQYKGNTFFGTLTFSETLIQNDSPPPDCDPLIEEYTGTKAFSYSPPANSIHLSGNRFGIIKQQVKSLASGEGAQQFLAQLLSQSQLPSSYYDFHAGGISGWQVISGTKRKHNKDGCYYADVEKKVTFSTIGLRFPILEDAPINGSETWRINIDRPPKNFSMKLSQIDIGNEVNFRPDSVKTADGSATYSISWSLGKSSWKPPEVEIQKVFFKYKGGDQNPEKCLQLWKHGNPEKKIESPEWVRGYTKNKKAAFVKDYLFRVKAEFQSRKPVKSAKIRAIETVIDGTGFGGNLEQVGELKISGTKITGEFIIKTAQEKIGTHTISWKWEGDIELEDAPGGQIKTDLGESEHTIYIVGGIPNTNVRAYEYAVKLGCKWAEGTEGGDTTFWGIWNSFEGIPSPNPQEKNLKYDHVGEWTTTNELLTNDEGKCGAWTDFFKDTVGVHGIDVVQVVIRPMPPYDILVTHPISGQANFNPTRVFINHAIVWYGGQYFDPSYKVEPYVGLTKYENKMFAGYCKKVDVDNYRNQRQNRSGSCALVGVDNISELADCLIYYPDHNFCRPNNTSEGSECEVYEE